MNSFFLKFNVLILFTVVFFSGCGDKFPEGLYSLPEKGIFEQADEQMENGASLFGAALGVARDLLTSNQDEYYIHVTSDSIFFVSKVNFISSYDAVLPNVRKELNFAWVFDANLEVEEGNLVLFNEKKKLKFERVQDDPVKMKAFKDAKNSAIKRQKRIESMTGPEQSYYNLMQAFAAMDFRTLKQLCAKHSGGYIELADLIIAEDAENIIKLFYPLMGSFLDEIVTSSVYCWESDKGSIQLCSHGPKTENSAGLPFVKEDGVYKLWLGEENLFTILMDVVENGTLQ